jgi:hypothetical protein
MRKQNIFSNTLKFIGNIKYISKHQKPTITDSKYECLMDLKEKGKKREL